MLNLIAQTYPTTQEATASMPGWAIGLIAVLGAIGVLIGTLGGTAGILALIRAARGEAKAEAAQTSLNRFSNRANAQDERVSKVERDMLPPGAVAARPSQAGREHVIPTPGTYVTTESGSLEKKP